jgi:hypothetical protein
MTRLRDTICIDRPAEETAVGLERFFESLTGSDGIAHLRLRVPVGGATRNYGIYLDRDVLVEARRARDEQNLNDVIRIDWSPEGAAVFPRFSGTLLVCGREGPGRSYIELDGSYAPPLGSAGQIFDAAIGHRIAKATARELLADVKAAIERKL